MQETKYYCDRCKKETEAMQAQKDIVRYWSSKQKKWEYNDFCSTCEKGIIAFINQKTQGKKQPQKGRGITHGSECECGCRHGLSPSP